jgi:hypothetical protein
MGSSKKEYGQGELVEPDALNKTRLRYPPMAYGGDNFCNLTG